MARGKYLSLEEARKLKQLDRGRDLSKFEIEQKHEQEDLAVMGDLKEKVTQLVA